MTKGGGLFSQKGEGMTKRKEKVIVACLNSEKNAQPSMREPLREETALG